LIVAVVIAIAATLPGAYSTSPVKAVLAVFAFASLGAVSQQYLAQDDRHRGGRNSQRWRQDPWLTLEGNTRSDDVACADVFEARFIRRFADEEL